MIRSSDFGGAEPAVLSIHNYHSPGGLAPEFFSVTQANLSETLSGALLAGELQEVLSLSGKGRLNFIAVKNMDATARTMRIRVILDDIEVFDATCASIANTTYAVVAVGGAGGSFQPVSFKVSCTVEIASSLTETNKLALLTNYEMHR